MDNSNKDLYKQIKNIDETIETLQRAKQQILKELNDLKYEKKENESESEYEYQDEDENDVANMPDEVLFAMLNELCDDDLLEDEFFTAVDELGKEKQKNYVGEDHPLNHSYQDAITSPIQKKECYDEFISHQSFYVGLVAEQIKSMIENNMVYTNAGPISKNIELDVTQFFEKCYMHDSLGTMNAQNFIISSIFSFICEDFEIDLYGSLEVFKFCIDNLRESDTDIYYEILNDVVKRINFLLKQK